MAKPGEARMDWNQLEIELFPTIGAVNQKTVRSDEMKDALVVLTTTIGHLENRVAH